MPRPCQAKLCCRTALFSRTADDPAEYCARHRPEDYCCRKSHGCRAPGCSRFARFGPRGGEREFCRRHAPADYISLDSGLCHVPGCQQPHLRAEKFCSAHSQPSNPEDFRPNWRRMEVEIPPNPAVLRWCENVLL